MMAHRWKDIRQKILPRTLYGRSLMIIVVPILLMQMIVAYIFIYRHWDSMSDKLAFALAGEIDMIADQISQTYYPADISRIVRPALESLDLKVTIESRSGIIPPSRRSESPTWNSVEDKLQKVLKKNLDNPFTIAAYPENKRFEVNVRLADNRVLKFSSYIRRLTSPATYVFILWLIGSSIILMAVSIMFMRNQIRPIRRLAVAADKFGKGQDVAKFKLEGAWEVRQAARAFLDMRDRIRRQIEQRTAMLAGVSHDLRTPLTRIKLQLAMMKNVPEVDNLRRDMDEMEKMLEGYLTFARGGGNEETGRVDIKSVLERIVGNSKRQQGSVVEACYEGRLLLLMARPVAVERALTNIVNNACKYAKNVWVDAHEQPEAVEIFIDDDGPGIPEEQRDEVFKPFYRLEKSRNPKTGGLGLGLSIAQDIIHGHGGEIFLEKSNHGGLKVVIRLPL